MMNKAFFLFLFLTGAAYAAYSPSTIITDPAGVNQATVKAASTAAVAADKALVVALSPNNSCAMTAASLPLPTGAATETTLSALNTKVTTTANGVKIDGSAVTQPVSAASLPLPAGASTSSNQTTGNTSLASIDGKTPSLGQAVMASSVPVAIASNQSAIATKSPINTNGAFAQITASGTVNNFSAPSNAVAVLIQGDSTNTDCIRWAVGSVPTATSGMVLQSGQDTGEIKVATTVSFIACSGSQKVNVQWIQSQ